MAETFSWHGDTGAKRDLGSRSRAERQRAQDGWWRPAVSDACPGGQAVQYLKKRVRIGC